MITILRNSTVVAVVTLLLAANIYWQLLNPYVACAIALIAAYAVGRAVELVFIKRASAEMWRRYGQDWVK